MREKLKKSIQKFKIFGRKKGRKIVTNSNIDFLKQYQLKLPSDLIGKKIILDVGSGNGENTLFLSQKYTNKLIITSEIYEDGNLNLCNQLRAKNINNVKIFDQNILILFEKMKKNNCIDEIWILFPDPWPKKKHHKRRLINSTFFKTFFSFLKIKGKIFIATDSSSYLIYILSVVFNTKKFRWINDFAHQWRYHYNEYLPQTKYYKRASKNNKKSFILIFQKI